MLSKLRLSKVIPLTSLIRSRKSVSILFPMLSLRLNSGQISQTLSLRTQSLSLNRRSLASGADINSWTLLSPISRSTIKYFKILRKRRTENSPKFSWLAAPLPFWLVILTNITSRSFSQKLIPRSISTFNSLSNSLSSSKPLARPENSAKVIQSDQYYCH